QLVVGQAAGAQLVDLGERRRQPRDRLVQPRRIAPRRRLGGGLDLRLARDRLQGAVGAAAGAHAVQAQVARDLEQPRAEAAQLRPRAARAQRREEGLVEHVLGLGRVAELGADEAEQRALEALVQPIERGELAAEQPRVQRLVGVGEAHQAGEPPRRTELPAAISAARMTMISASTRLWSDSSHPSANVFSWSWGGT